MKVAVVGGTGVRGKPLGAARAARGDEVLALSRTAPRKLPDGASHRSVDLTTGEGLAEALAGVEVIVGVSIVGCGRVPMAYYKVKVEQEEAIAGAATPWSLLRATQFHPLIAWAFGEAGRLRVVPTRSAPLQPIDPPVVVERLTEAAHGEPAGRLPDIAGPQVHTLTELRSEEGRVGKEGRSRWSP